MIFEMYIQSYISAFNQLERGTWNYQDGCVLTALQGLYEASGDSFYAQSISAFMDHYIQPDGYIRTYDDKEYNLDKIPPGRVLFFLYNRTGRPDYRLAIERLNEQLKNHPRTVCGSFWHKKIYPYQIHNSYNHHDY